MRHGPNVWANVQRRAQADDSVWDRVTRPLGDIAERGISGGVRSYLQTDPRVDELLGTVKFVAIFAGGLLALYVISQSEGRK